MKKIRISLLRGRKTWSFVLHDSSESAFYLKDEPALSEGDDEYRKVVVLKSGDHLEVEWSGSEWVYADETVPSFLTPFDLIYDKFDRVRVGKMTMVKGVDGKKDTAYLEIYSGWVVGGAVPWRQEDAEDGLRITPIKGRMRSKMDFSKLFKGTALEDDELAEEKKMMGEEPVVLN